MQFPVTTFTKAPQPALFFSKQTGEHILARRTGQKINRKTEEMAWLFLLSERPSSEEHPTSDPGGTPRADISRTSSHDSFLFFSLKWINSKRKTKNKEKHAGKS